VPLLARLDRSARRSRLGESTSFTFEVWSPVRVSRRTRVRSAPTIGSCRRRAHQTDRHQVALMQKLKSFPLSCVSLVATVLHVRPPAVTGLRHRTMPSAMTENLRHEGMPEVRGAVRRLRSPAAALTVLDVITTGVVMGLDRCDPIPSAVAPSIGHRPGRRRPASPSLSQGTSKSDAVR